MQQQRWDQFSMPRHNVRTMADTGPESDLDERSEGRRTKAPGKGLTPSKGKQCICHASSVMAELQFRAAISASLQVRLVGQKFRLVGQIAKTRLIRTFAQPSETFNQP
ncbi:hypothetical protein, partial [Stackebrandtia soli]|uniref:hypothetical protein n=1 Tax=Stackebrandtia soli TaxID=1892856 RepID=UPI0039EB83FE